MSELDYSDVSLVAKYFDGDSRSKLDTSIELCGHTFKLPAIPSNMKCCIDYEIAEKLSEAGYFYVLHRFMPYKELCQWILDSNEKDLKMISISLGVQDQDYKLVEWLVKNDSPVDFITVDIAHGHCKKMRDFLSHCKTVLVDEPTKIIAGNVMTRQGVEDLSRWGADAVKVGIGPGAACSTKLMTGFHSPMFSTIQKCKISTQTAPREVIAKKTEQEAMDYVNNTTRPKMHHSSATFEPSFSSPWDELVYIKANTSNGNLHIQQEKFKEVLNNEIDKRFQDCQVDPVPIIADGGIRHPGDIAKAIAAGADMVMVGSMFTACVDSPAEDIMDDDTLTVKKKVYYGSASVSNGNNKNIEGTTVELDCNGKTYMEYLDELQGHLQSAISYCGGDRIDDLKGCEYIQHA